MAIEIGRREFIAALGGATVTWPLVARVQQDERIRRIGVLIGLTENDPEGQLRIMAFRRGLQSHAGLVEIKEQAPGREVRPACGR